MYILFLIGFFELNFIGEILWKIISLNREKKGRKQRQLDEMIIHRKVENNNLSRLQSK